MKQEDWTQHLKERLADHEEPVPADLWAHIEAQLTTPQKKAAVWHRWVAAAAVIVLLAGGSLFTVRTLQEKRYVAQNSEALLPQPSPEEDTEPEDLIATVNPDEQLPRQNIRQTQAPQQLRKSIELTTAHASSLNEQQDATVNTADQTEQQETPMQNGLQQAVPTKGQHTPSHTIQIKKTKPRLFPTATLYAMNTFSDRQHNIPVRMSSEMADKFNMNNNYTSHRSATIWLSDYEEREHHDQPVTIGLKLSYPFTERLSISTGLVYSKLQADFATIMKGQEINRTQTLWYAGVPLSIEYRLLQWRHFGLYASTGIQADWNVKARQSTNGTEVNATKDHCQWSVKGSLGVTYQLIPHVGLFVEPAISHHFNNNSSVSTYFKERPTTMSLQLGVRLNIGKKDKSTSEKE